MNDKIVLEINQPITVAFKYREGKLCEKKWPGAEDCYARQTDDGRVIFVDANTEMRLRKACPNAGTPVVLTLAKTQGGNKYITIKSAAPTVKAPMGVHNGGRSALPPEKFADSDWHSLGATTPEVQPLPAQAVEHGSTDSRSLLARCLIEAVDAALTAQRHAQAVGFPLVFGPDQIEAMGVSIFIARTRDGAVTERKPAGYVNGVDRSHHTNERPH